MIKYRRRNSDVVCIPFNSLMEDVKFHHGEFTTPEGFKIILINDNMLAIRTAEGYDMIHNDEVVVITNDPSIFTIEKVMFNQLYDIIK